MERLKRQKKYKEDSLQILSGDHIRILFRNARSGPFEAVISSGGAVLDRVHDPDRFGGDYTSWNSALHRPVIRYYKDRWEMEILFGNIGMIPDFEPAWGFRVERVRTLNGRRQMAANCEGRSFEMGKWSALSFPKTDSFGVEYISSGCVVRPLKGIPNGEVYCIGKARNKVTFSPEAWSDPAAWGKVPESRLGNELFYYWRSNMVGHRPDTAFKMLYDEKNLYIFYKVRDRYVRGNCKKDQGMVCVDSCVELFIMPGGQGKYFNFEMNCVGSLLLYQITPVGRRTLMERVPMEELKKVKRYHSLPRDLKGEITEEVCWYAALEIPLDFFVRFAGVTLPLRGQVWTGNVYKCADWTSHPCWLTWRRTITFHAVDGFGKFIFE